MSQTYVQEKPETDETRRPAPDTVAVRREKPKAKPKASSTDLVYGQPVIVAMRWILVASGLLLVLWNPDSLSTMKAQIVVILLLALANFYLHAQLLMKRPVFDQVVYAASAIDLVLVTLLIALGNGYDSRLYVYYFPAILSFAVVFPSAMTITYVGSTIGVYGAIAIMTGGDPLIILSRFLMIAAVGFCGNLYLRLERSRRNAARESQQRLMAQIRQRQQDVA